MKFLLQQGVLLDFVFAMQKAKEWWDWWKPKDNIVEFVDSGCSKEICPIGSLEFCLDYYKKLGIDLKPINVPDYLFQYSIGYGNGSVKGADFPEWIKELEKRTKMRIVKTSSMSTEELTSKTIGIDSLLNLEWRGGMYVKSETRFKYPGNGLYNSINSFITSEYYDPSDKYQVTHFDPEIADEWRYFVYEGKVVGCKCYVPEDILSPKIPSKRWVLDKISKIDLPAYTLDVAMSNKPTVVDPKIIEVHDFFSCGLYGFDDYNLLPYMFFRSHLYKFNKYGG